MKKEKKKGRAPGALEEYVRSNTHVSAALRRGQAGVCTGRKTAGSSHTARTTPNSLNTEKQKTASRHVKHPGENQRKGEILNPSKEKGNLHTERPGKGSGFLRNHPNQQARKCSVPVLKEKIDQSGIHC